MALNCTVCSFILLGDNIGTCITAVLASLRANLTAKRVAAAHVMFNVIGSIIFVVFMPFFIKFVLLVSPDGDIARQIANAHSAFNILNTLLFMPFVNPFIKLVEKIVPGKAEIISMRPVYLDKNMLNTPSIAISLAVKEVVRMGELARKDVRLGMEAIQSFDADKVKYVLEHEPVVDALERDITDYLTQMSSSEMSESLTTRHTGLLHACTDIERIGDHGETLAKRARKLVEEDVVFSDEAKAELLQLSASNRIIMDYSIHDAIEAGFNHVVFIIRKDIEKEFKEVIGDRIAAICADHQVTVDYAFQDSNDIPGTLPEGRTKPWGTGQAVLAAKNILSTPFIVINADDYYGKEGFRAVHEYLV